MTRARVWLAAAIAVAACSEPEPVEPEPTVAEPVVAAAERPEELPAAQPVARAEREAITFESEDGARIVGTLRRGPEPDAPLAVLVHQLGSDRSEWDGLIARLDPSIAVAVYDVRGHGQSIQTADGDVLAYASFTEDDWAKTPGDLARVLRGLREEHDLSPSRTVLVGSSIGSSAVLRVGADDESVTGVVALSPGRAYRGLTILEAVARYPGDRAILAIAAEGEAASAETAEAIREASPTAQVRLIEGDEHGVSMFDADPASRDVVRDFIREELEL